MKTYRASRLYPLLLFAGSAALIYVFLKDYERDRLGRTLAASAFVLATWAQAVLLLVQTELRFDDRGITFRERRSFGGAKPRTIPLGSLARIRIKGRLVRLKLTDDDVIILQLGILSGRDRREVAARLRELPQYVADPLAGPGDGDATRGSSE